MKGSRGMAVVVASATVAAWSLTPGAVFVVPRGQPDSSSWAQQHRQMPQADGLPSTPQFQVPLPIAALAASTVALAAAAASAASRRTAQATAHKRSFAGASKCRGNMPTAAAIVPVRGDVARAGWPFEDDDPYSKCTAIRLQVGMQFSKSLLDALNKLAESADTESDGGLHELMLQVVIALRRQQAVWRYGSVDRLVSSSEDEGREANGALQRWGIDGQAKWGDGEDWEKMNKSAPTGVTEYLVVTMSMSCYGMLCPDVPDLKVRSITDVMKILDAVSGVQVDELIQLDVQWIPEEPGDSLSAMELTLKFPELALL